MGRSAIISNDSFVSSLQLLKQACRSHPHLKVKIGLDSLEKGYISLEEAADFMGLTKEHWVTYLKNYKEGDLNRIAPDLRNTVPPTELRFLSGFTDEQLRIVERAWEMPFLITESHEGVLPLVQELRVLMILGLVLQGKHHKFRSFKARIIW